MVIFSSVWFLLKKIIKTCFFKKKKPKPVQTDRFRFGYVQLFWGKNRFFRFGSVFSSLAWFFFGLIFSISGLQNQNRTGRFFQNYNRFNQFFFTVRFFQLFFSFLGLIDFLIFLLILIKYDLTW